MPRTILFAGASGLIGRRLVETCRAASDAVRVLTRTTPRSDNEFAWDPAREALDPRALDGVDTVVCLSGAGIADKRWTRSRKRELIQSRVDAVRTLANAIASAATPRTFVCASATGYYGDRTDEWLDETSPRGKGFLAELCEAWESAADPARSAGARVAHLRFGVVLTREGGALAKMLPLFRAGLGGPLGNGRQYMPWISLVDAVAAARFVVEREPLSGPFNVVSPHAVTNREFTRTLARSINRRAVLPAPAFVLRLSLGEIAAELLLAGQRVRPAKLENAGFSFRQARLEEHFAAELGR